MEQVIIQRFDSEIIGSSNDESEWGEDRDLGKVSTGISNRVFFLTRMDKFFTSRAIHQ